MTREGFGPPGKTTPRDPEPRHAGPEPSGEPGMALPHEDGYAPGGPHDFRFEEP